MQVYSSSCTGVRAVITDTHINKTVTLLSEVSESRLHSYSDSLIRISTP
jgi:hypothetical protein